MSHLNSLVHFTHTPHVEAQPGRKVLGIPKTLMSLDALYDFYGEALGKDRYMGRNPSAFIDCLTDPDRHLEAWHELVLVHSSIPKMQKQDVALYLEILIGAHQRAEGIRKNWPGYTFKLTVLFCIKDRQKLIHCAKNRLMWLEVEF